MKSEQKVFVLIAICLGVSASIMEGMQAWQRPFIRARVPRIPSMNIRRSSHTNEHVSQEVMQHFKDRCIAAKRIADDEYKQLQIWMSMSSACAKRVSDYQTILKVYSLCGHKSDYIVKEINFLRTKLMQEERQLAQYNRYLLPKHRKDAENASDTSKMYAEICARLSIRSGDQQKTTHEELPMIAESTAKLRDASCKE